MLLIHSDLLTILGLQTKSYILPKHSVFMGFTFSHPPCGVDLRALLTLSENQLLKQRRKKTGLLLTLSES